MKKIRLAIIGLGNLGKKCAQAVLADSGMELAGVVRRPESAPVAWPKAPSAAHISELPAVDVALVCVPADVVAGTAATLLQARIPIVECARLHGDAFVSHKADIHRTASRHRTAAVVGAGCDPGVLSLFRSQFALLAPHGRTDTRLHAGTSLHHTLAAAAVKGVRKALATELQSHGGALQRYVYVELEPSADADAVKSALASDPLFLDEETLVFAVPSVDVLQQTDRGVVLERHAAADAVSPGAFLLEARYDEAGLAARMMVAAARAVPHLAAGAHSPLDLPPGMLWGEMRPAAEREWI